MNLLHGFSCRSSKDNKIQQRVGSESVGSMDRGASGFSCSHQSWDNNIIAVLIRLEHLGFVVGGDTSHIIMNSWEYRDGLFSSINTSEDVCGLKDTWKSLLESLGWQVMEAEMNVIFVRPASSSFEDLHSH